MYRTLPTALALVVLSTCQPIVRAQTPQDLLLKTPDWTNALVIVDLKSLLASPLAQREGWHNKPMLETLGGALPFPKGSDAVLLAAHLEPGTLTSSADVALLVGGQLPTMDQLAKQVQGATDILAGAPAVQSNKNTYFVSLNPSTLAVFAPAQRQDAARWVRFTQQNKSPAISGYLNQATNALKDGYHIVVALDLTDVVDPNLARHFLSKARALKDKKVDLEALVKVLSSVRGVRIGVRVDQGIRATLAGDFAVDIKPFADVLPALLLNALDEMGGELEEFPASKATIQDKTFLITSQLTPRGLRQVMNLVPPVTAPVAAAKEAATPPVAKDQPAVAPAPAVDPATANKRYFDRVYQLATDAHTSAEKRSDFMRAVSLYEKAASQIDGLPVLGIDTDLLRYAQGTSVKLRDIADALRASYAEASKLEGQKMTNVQVVPGGFLGGFTIGAWNLRNPGDPFSPRGAYIYPWVTPDQYRVQSNETQVSAKQTEILHQGLKKRGDIWRQFTDETGAVRKNMSVKFQIAF